MNVLGALLQIPLQGQRLAPMERPMLGLFAFFHVGLAVVFVAAIVFLAWKIGSYYDAAKKKL